MRTALHLLSYLLPSGAVLLLELLRPGTLTGPASVAAVSLLALLVANGFAFFGSTVAGRHFGEIAAGLTIAGCN